MINESTCPMGASQRSTPNVIPRSILESHSPVQTHLSLGDPKFRASLYKRSPIVDVGRHLTSALPIHPSFPGFLCFSPMLVVVISPQLALPFALASL